MRTMTWVAFVAMGIAGMAGLTKAQDAQLAQQWDAMEVSELASVALGLDRSSIWDNARYRRQELGIYTLARYTTARGEGQLNWQQWLPLIVHVAGDIPAESRATVASEMRSALIPTDQAVQGLDAVTAARVVNALLRLGQADIARQTAITYLSDSENWPSATVEDLGILCLVVPKDDTTTTIRTSLAQDILANRLGSPATIVSGPTWAWQQLARATAPLLTDQQKTSFRGALRSAFLQSSSVTPRAAMILDKAIATLGGPAHDAELAWHVYAIYVSTPEARSTMNMRLLHEVSLMMQEAGQTGNDVGAGTFADFALAVADVAQRTGLESNTPMIKREIGFLVPPLTSPSTHDVLRAELLDPVGKPRLGIAKLVAWTYVMQGELSQWLARLDQEISEAVDADERALWLLVKGYSKSLVQMTWSRRPDPRNEWSNQALATASSVEVKYEAAREIAKDFAELDEHDQAIQLMESLAGQFEGTAVAEKYKCFKIQLAEARTEAQAQQQSAQDDMDARMRVLRIRDVKRRLSQARARGDAETAARFEQLLSELQSQ